jgi:hypothetical protein
MSVKIYVVMGSTGEYSDHSTWTVCAYQDKQRAEEHADLAMMEARKIREHDDYFNSEDKNIYDPKMQMQYTGTDYYTIDVDLLDAIPGIDD